MERVTSEDIQWAELNGACREELPKVGQRICDLSQLQLTWAHDHGRHGIDGIPLWALAASGNGYGRYGDGYGHGEFGVNDGACGYGASVASRTDLETARATATATDTGTGTMAQLDRMSYNSSGIGTSRRLIACTS